MSGQTALYTRIASMQNLWQAAHRTLLRGRRYRPKGAEFKLGLERHLYRLHRDLSKGTYRHGAYKAFYIYEPKQRQVLAASLRDRIVHHALHDVLEPHFDRKYIYDNYACRVGKGTHAALRRAHHFLRSQLYFVHLDVKKYFPSIDHDVLKRVLRKHLVQRDVLDLCDHIIDSTVESGSRHGQMDLFRQAPKGLPIGNLTSQLFANMYLNELDQYIKHMLRHKHYLRYMDDFVLFGSDRKQLCEVQRQVSRFCADPLRLSLHIKGGVKHHSEGLGFLGFRLYRKYIKLKGVCLTRYLRKYRWMQKRVQQSRMDRSALHTSIQCWFAHIAQANTEPLKRQLAQSMDMRVPT